MITTTPDRFYPSNFQTDAGTKRASIGNGLFKIALNALFKETYGYEIEFTEFGKPHLSTKEYVEQYIRQRIPAVSRFYMIGDNLETDISFANNRLP